MNRLQDKAAALGFDMLGVIPALPGRRLDAYLSWIAAEMHGAMGYMARPDRVIRRRDLNVILPAVQSLICVGSSYYTAPIPDAIANDPARGRISRYAWHRDYHDLMEPRLEELADWLRQTAVGSTSTRVYVDTGAILERDHAETAGLGFIGKNSLLIAPRRGSYFFLGEILTTLPISAPQAVAAAPQKPSCGRCRRCLDACPTNAFPEPYVLDARRCISYLTIELKGWIPAALRPLLGNWIYGCDVCQEVCPFNRFAQPTREAAYYPSGKRGAIDDWNAVAPSLLEILTMDEAGFKERFADSPIKRIKRRRLVRNACVAAGNWGSATAVFPLINLLTDPEPIARGHAAWALGQIGGDWAETAVRQALKTETDKIVLRELQGAWRLRD